MTRHSLITDIRNFTVKLVRGHTRVTDNRIFISSRNTVIRINAGPAGIVATHLVAIIGFI